MMMAAVLSAEKQKKNTNTLFTEQNNHTQNLKAIFPAQSVQIHLVVHLLDGLEKDIVWDLFTSDHRF